MPAEQTPRLLFLSHRLPFPPHNGAAIRTYNILKLLAERFQVTAMCFDRQDPATSHMPLAERMGALEKIGRVEVFPIPQETSRARLAWDHARSIVTGRAYTYYVHESAPFVASLRRHIGSGEYQVAHMDSLDLVYYLPFLTGIPVICTHHNVESTLMEQRATAETSLFRRNYLAHQSRLLRAEEERWLGRVDLNIAVSPEDKTQFELISAGARCEVIPNGVDTDEFRPADVSQSGCVFVGGTSWFPNKDALAWFTEEILPQLNALPERPVTIWVGRASDEEIQRHTQPGLKLTGYVTDIRPYVNDAAVFIAPLRVGGGTRLKILDAWAMGKAVVSTSVGSEGLATRHGENILIADDPASFVDATSKLLRDDALRRRIGMAARRLVEERYSWEFLGGKIERLYMDLIRDSIQNAGIAG